MKTFKNKVVVITGAGSGMGRAYAMAFARLGAKLALNDYDREALGQSVALLPEPARSDCFHQAIDVADETAFAAFAAAVKQSLGNAHVIINNAGIEGAVKPIWAISKSEIERVMAVNFYGVVNGTRLFLPQLFANGEGAVINVSSVFGLIGTPSNSDYCASKFAVRGFTESLRQELDLASHGVSASCVHPGGIKTNIARSARINASMKDLTGVDGEKSTAEFEKLFSTTADQAAATILKGVRKNARRILIGLDARAIDSFQRSLPANYQALLTGAFKLGRRLRS